MEDEEVYVVRRLSPTECSRLQGFPNGWMDLGEWTTTTGKKMKESDTPKYRAAGNSIAIPFWFHLLSAISEELGEGTHTMGSLFSGIGGFDLCWTYVNGMDSVLWESEIEEFPMAVTKRHFGDEEAGIEGDFKKFFKKYEDEN